MYAISSYRGNRPTHKHTNRTDYNTLCRSLARSVTKDDKITLAGIESLQQDRLNLDVFVF